MPDESRTQHATLGCGTLILIALIVMFFSRPGTTDLEREVQALHSEVAGLKKAMESQTSEMKALQKTLEGLHPAKAVKPQGEE